MDERTWPEIRAYILLTSEADLLSEVTALLGPPDEYREKGLPVHPANPNRKRDRNFYSYGQVERCKCLDVPALIDSFVFKFEGKGTTLVQLGLEVGLQIVVHYEGDQAPILYLRPEVLAILHSANASVDIDTYP